MRTGMVAKAVRQRLHPPSSADAPPTMPRQSRVTAARRARFQDRVVFGSLIGAAALLLIAVLLVLFH